MATPDLDWLIIGGGIHGTHLALALLRGAGVPRGRLRILDPHAALLARWRACTANTGMTMLRSPGVHQLDLDPAALFTFAKSPAGRALPPPKGVYGRPSLAMFDAHCDTLVRQHRLTELHVAARAEGLIQRPGGWCVDTSSGRLTARNVVLAIGAAEQPCWPMWATAVRDAGGQVYHIFDADVARAALPAWSHVVVVGGGITAAQTALALAERAPGTVTLLQRHPTRVAPFDSDPCWMGPKCQERFAREGDLRRRRELIRAARQRGSVPDDIAHHLRRVVRDTRLTQRIGEVVAAERDGAGTLRLTLADGADLTADGMVLATGFAPHRPGGDWLGQAITTADLPVAPCGYPVVDAPLRWAPGLYVSGPLAELEVGPVARNIIGARQASRRLVAAARMGTMQQ